MRNVEALCLKWVRWSSWPLLALLVGFFVTGYSISGRYGMGAQVTEQTALMLHKLLHAPLILLTAAHVLPAIYLAIKRWRWVK